MEIFKMMQNIPQYNYLQQKTERDNSKNLVMEIIDNTKTNLENKINNIISILQTIKEENDTNIRKSNFNNYY